MHWTKNCQHKRPQNANIVETSEEETDSGYEIGDVNFVLMTTQNPRKDFVEEMITKAVINTTCTKLLRDNYSFKITWKTLTIIHLSR